MSHGEYRKMDPGDETIRTWLGPVDFLTEGIHYPDWEVSNSHSCPSFNTKWGLLSVIVGKMAVCI